MQLLVWCIGIVILTLWSVTVWLGHAATNLMLTLPWDQALAALRQIEMPAVIRPLLEPFMGGVWSAWIDALTPLLQWTGGLLQGSSQWLLAALPVIAWLIWALGSVMILGLAVAASLALYFFKRKNILPVTGVGTVTGDASLFSLLNRLRSFKR